MRLPYVLLMLATSALVTCEALSLTIDSTQISEAASPASSSQRLLRARHATRENDSEDEERALSTREMKKMKKKLTTKEDFAATLGIADKISDNLNGGALMRFMQTTEYQKDRAYMDFLNDMAKKPKYADLVRQIKGH
ncbi:secreted RxLR effector peptide protein, putative [Phytophthora infestans T30-4]|uniref:Secreted RxLR effector peptide protein, putative n=2 Tax=Phytophthora infestans TaxID=4787 RepID=D0NCP7_PHYIT|nr:secreted RxLR effector peptide protein, putative [Phytophthora infestans T30-4]EEY55761.1 secreted RxLR effector peptide protein, putative [Phytophthora infestans T30-4]KAF4139618.1 WYL domain [Phytophthora infestans]|eukprot:XP_002903337.1 secreted RxLR effector peptide protein, putative [Phytophthora infestans T30-4]